MYRWPTVLEFIISLLVFFSCSKEQPLPTHPQITQAFVYPYKMIPTRVGRGFQDSVVLGIRVNAGEADLGVDRPVDSLLLSNFLIHGNWTNYKITVLRLVENKFEPVDVFPNKDIVFFPSFTNSNSKKVKEGYIYFNRNFIYYPATVMALTKFQIQIRDNLLNESNTVETDTIELPYPKQR